MLKETTKNLPKIIFDFDKEWELKNWRDSCFKNITYDVQGKKWDLGGIPQDVEDELEKSGTEDDVRIKIKNIFDSFIETPKAVAIIQDITDRAKRRWDEVGEKCLIALSEMLQIPIEEFAKDYCAYFTFGRRCPFYDNKFMFNQFSDFPVAASHEIMHIEFLKKYRDHCIKKGLIEIQIEDLKEILTVLLNEDLKDFFYLPDRGYPRHKKIRKGVLKLYQENKKEKRGFVLFLDKSIDLLKKDWKNITNVT